MNDFCLEIEDFSYCILDAISTAELYGVVHTPIANVIVLRWRIPLEELLGLLPPPPPPLTRLRHFQNNLPKGWHGVLTRNTESLGVVWNLKSGNVDVDR
jgi:hypothetical protein